MDDFVAELFKGTGSLLRRVLAWRPNARRMYVKNWCTFSPLAGKTSYSYKPLVVREQEKTFVRGGGGGGG